MIHTPPDLRARQAFSLIELVVAMLAASILLASLAGSIAITSQLLEPDELANQRRRETEINDRIANDLRYATQITPHASGDGFDVQRIDPFTQTIQSIRYDSSPNELTRTADNSPTITLNATIDSSAIIAAPDTPSATTATGTGSPRLRSMTVASTSSSSSSLSLEVPAGVVSGDLILICVSAKSPSNITISEAANWTTLQSMSNGYLMLHVAYRFYDANWPSTVVVATENDAQIASTMLAIQDVNFFGPVSWTASRRNNSPFSDLSPTSLEPESISDTDLNIQVFGADGSPWHTGTIGMASFSDVVQRRAGEGSFWFGNSVGATLRIGGSSDQESVPRMLHRSIGSWIQAAVILRGQTL
ncbi:MAG: prepilin-type N-terminal cleavage/methylation domain-containing protein [Rubripirellula sp.]